MDLASVGWKSPLDRRLRSRVATRPIQFTGMEERHTPKSELLRFANLVRAEKVLDIQWGWLVVFANAADARLDHISRSR